MAKEPVVFGWSGGKDSALALQEILRSRLYEVVALLTTCTEGFRRISMHGVRCSLLKTQASQLGIPLRKVFIEKGSSNADYEVRMCAALLEYQKAGVNKVIFGDLFLEQIREYRDRMLAGIGMSALYPLWGRNTRALAGEFIRAGFQAVLVCVDPRQLDASFAGRLYNETLLSELPSTVDPCGENGEFHTFVFNGPIFQKPVKYRPGRVVSRDQFIFADLLPHSKSIAQSNNREIKKEIKRK
ncbi:MAG: protein of unknown function ATP-binding region [Verrucomicrobiales bacterium]|nr:protein of unknown function ATP-binding region [Verrucomicrobiales bacterium]